MPTFGAWPISGLIHSGPDPFGSEVHPCAEAVGASSLTLMPQAQPRFVLVEGDELTEGGEAPGPALERAEVVYAYLIRPLGHHDAAENRVLYVLELEDATLAVATPEPLAVGESYAIVGIGGEAQAPLHTGLTVCFAAGTLVATRRGPKRVETLVPGDRLQTCDNGFAPVRWLGRWRVGATGAAAPVRFAPGVLGNDRALDLSPQHQVLIRPSAGPLAGEEVLVAAKTLVGLPGVSRTPRAQVEWVHVLLPAHEVIFAENMRCETLLAGEAALATMEPSQAALLRAQLADDPLLCVPARPVVPAARVARMVLQPLLASVGLRSIA